MEVIIDGVQYAPMRAACCRDAEELCCNVAHGRPLHVGDYVVVDSVAYSDYAVDANVLGKTGKVVDWPYLDAFVEGQLAVELPGYSVLGQHTFGFWPGSLSRFEEK